MVGSVESWVTSAAWRTRGTRAKRIRWDILVIMPLKRLFQALRREAFPQPQQGLYVEFACKAWGKIDVPGG